LAQRVLIQIRPRPKLRRRRNMDRAAPAAANQPGGPAVTPLVGPVILNRDLRDLPYIAPNPEVEQKRLTRYPHPEIPSAAGPNPSGFERFESLLKQIIPPTPMMPGPILTFDGMNSAQSGCLCLPPDTDGDVGPNHYVQSVNSSIKIFDKNGNPLNGPNGTTYNSFFLTLVGTPCSGFNNGDGFVFYDHVANRWVVSDFAFTGSLPGAGPFYQCIGVSQTGDPVSGGWFLYAVQHDPANPTWIGDYPKFAFWPDAYYRRSVGGGVKGQRDPQDLLFSSLPPNHSFVEECCSLAGVQPSHFIELAFATLTLLLRTPTPKFITRNNFQNIEQNLPSGVLDAFLQSLSKSIPELHSWLVANEFKGMSVADQKILPSPLLDTPLIRAGLENIIISPTLLIRSPRSVQAKARTASSNTSF